MLDSVEKLAAGRNFPTDKGSCDERGSSGVTSRNFTTRSLAMPLADVVSITISFESVQFGIEGTDISHSFELQMCDISLEGTQERGRTAPACWPAKFEQGSNFAFRVLDSWLCTLLLDCVGDY